MPHTPTLPQGHIATLEDVKADCYWKLTQLAEMLDEQLRSLDDDLAGNATQPAKRFVGVGRLTSLYGRLVGTVATLEKKMAPRQHQPPKSAPQADPDATPSAGESPASETSAETPRQPASPVHPSTEALSAKASEIGLEPAVPQPVRNPDQLPPPISTYQRAWDEPEPFYPIHYPTFLRLSHPQPQVYRHYMDHKPPYSLLLCKV